MEIREEVIRARYFWIWSLASFFLKLVTEPTEEASVTLAFTLKSNEDILENNFGLSIQFPFLLYHLLKELTSLSLPIQLIWAVTQPRHELHQQGDSSGMSQSEVGGEFWWISPPESWSHRLGLVKQSGNPSQWQLTVHQMKWNVKLHP